MELQGEKAAGLIHVTMAASLRKTFIVVPSPDVYHLQKLSFDKRVTRKMV